MEIDAEFGPPIAPLLLATGPVKGGALHGTQKSPGMPLTGEVRTFRDEYKLDGGVASFDYSNGLLARETSWRWASAHNLEMGFNLQSGYFGGHENALWIDGEVVPLAPAHFIFDPQDPMQRWHIFTEDDQLELFFTPDGARRQDRNLLVAASRYIQPVGYTLMSLLGFQMLNNGVHWASDYPLALALGYGFGKIAVNGGRRSKLSEDSVRIGPTVINHHPGLQARWSFGRRS